MNTNRFIFIRFIFIGFFVIFVILGISLNSKADSYLVDSDLLAQYGVDDSYDPFADYSEFEESGEEEADINFFHNGRLFNVGLLAGMRGFTSTMGDMYNLSNTFGIFISYFFNLRFALQFSFRTGDHRFEILSSNSSDEMIGNATFSILSANIKYYLNTQNVTKGLADFNPYIIGGISQYYRTFIVKGHPDYGKDSAIALDGGAGVEVPIMGNSLYLALEAVYHYANFPDENSQIYFNDDVSKPTGIYPAGDVYTILGIVGINF